MSNARRQAPEHESWAEKVPGLAGLIAAHARRSPDAPFLRWRDEMLSYGSADLLIRSVAQRLLAEDAAHGETGRIAVFSQNSPAAIILWLAAQAAGLTPVTLNREHRGEMLVDIVQRSAPSTIICDPQGAQVITEAAVSVGLSPIVVGVERMDDVAQLMLVGVAPLSEIDCQSAAAPATIMFSSGTTGISKGVVIPHGMFDAGSARLRDIWGVTEDDVFHCWLPWFHVAAQQDVFALAIRAGASVALFERFSLSKFWEQIQRSHATIFGGFVTVLEMLYAQPPAASDTEHFLRFGIAGHLPAALKCDFERRFNVPMLDAYGMSEAEPLTIPTLEPPVPTGSVGRANPDFEIEVQDPEGARVAAGKEGQIVFRALRPNVMMREYLDDAERTAAAYNGGWFRTGDLGRMDEEGNLFYRDRLSQFIRVSGENVSPQEVESVLMTHPEIVEAAVLGVPSSQGEHSVVAVIVARQQIDEKTLREWCEGRMAKFMIPSRMLFVDRIPRTPTSKVQRASLAELLNETTRKES